MSGGYNFNMIVIEMSEVESFEMILIKKSVLGNSKVYQTPAYLLLYWD